MNIANDQISFRCKCPIVWEQHCKESSCQSVGFLKKNLAFSTRSLIKNNTKDLVKKAKFFLKNLTDWHDESLQCCCHTITHLHLFYSHWQYSTCFICLEILINFVGNWQNCFLLKILSRKLSLIDMMSLYSVVVTQ